MYNVFTLSAHYFCHISKMYILYIFPKISQKSNFVQIRPVGAQSFHSNRQMKGRTDGQTLTKNLTLIVLMWRIG